MTAIRLGFTALNLAARFPRVAGVFGKVPKAVWEALTVAAYALALIAAHQHYVHAHDQALVKATIARRDGQWLDQLAKSHAAAVAARTKTEAAAAKISTDTKGIHDAQVSHNAVDARDLQLRGPGKAAAAAYCGPGGHPGVPAAAGRHVEAAAGADAAAGEVHPGNGLAGVPQAPVGNQPGPATSESGAPALAVVPWSWLVDRGQEFDDLLAEATAWRTWHPKEAALLEKMRSDLQAKAKAAQPPKEGTPDGR
jgi:hypothetical protein